jgi:hypothetical protein
MNDLSGFLREAGWLLGCFAGAIAFEHFVSEDKYNQTPFVTLCFYVLTGSVRLGLWAWRRRH